MAVFHQLPSGECLATVRPEGKMKRKKLPTKSQAREWAQQQEQHASETSSEASLAAAIRSIREDLALDEQDHQRYGQPLGEWVEVRRADLAVILREAERDA